MDTINLTGVWINFPGISTLGKQRAAAGIYHYLLQMERSSWKKKDKKETAQAMRHRLLREVEKRIVQRDEDDLAVLLMA